METKQETTQQGTQTQTAAERSALERQLLAQLSQMMQTTSGQINLGGLASGEAPVVTPEIRELVAGIVNPQAEMERGAVAREFEGQGRRLSGAMESSGLGDSSIEAVQRAVLGRAEAGHMADIEARRTSGLNQMALDVSGQTQDRQLSANEMLMRQFLGAGGMLNENYLRDRLAQLSTATTGSGTMTQSGGELGALMTGVSGTNFRG